MLFRNQGLVKVRAYVFHLNDKGEVDLRATQRQFAHPYSIIKAKNEPRTYDSFVDAESSGYYSHAVLVSYDPDEYPLEEACLFRSYVPVDRLDELEMFCVVELLF
ncbi:MAG: hypothetical protein JST59_01670, partial [Actinobacteria bacterium]|nr:hypothetical protein [Actinomycetota bacterium]